MFRRKQEVTEPEIQDTIPLKCFLCQGAWTGTNNKDLEKHLENDHKVIFGIKEITELSGNQTDEAEITEEVAATAGDDERQEEEDPAPSEMRVERETGEGFAT